MRSSQQYAVKMRFARIHLVPIRVSVDLATSRLCRKLAVRVSEDWLIGQPSAALFTGPSASLSTHISV